MYAHVRGEKSAGACGRACMFEYAGVRAHACVCVREIRVVHLGSR